MTSKGENKTLQAPDSQGSTEHPRWCTPDSIIYWSTKDEGAEAYVVNLDAVISRRLTNLKPLQATRPACSQDGTKFIIDTRVGEVGYEGNIDGTNVKRIPNIPKGSPPRNYTPDGTSYTLDSTIFGNYEVALIEIGGSTPINLTNNGATDWGAEWCGDSSKFAFMSNRDGEQYDIYTANANGSNQTRITHNPTARDFFPVWSPDCTKIAFSSNRDGNYQIYVMNADGSNQVNISNNGAQDLFPSWRPSRNPVVITTATPAPTPPPTSTPIPTATATPVPTATPIPTATPSPVPTATPSPTPSLAPPPKPKWVDIGGQVFERIPLGFWTKSRDNAVKVETGPRTNIPHGFEEITQEEGIKLAKESILEGNGNGFSPGKPVVPGETLYDYWEREEPGILQPNPLSNMVWKDSEPWYISTVEQEFEWANDPSLENIGTVEAPLYIPIGSPAWDLLNTTAPIGLETFPVLGAFTGSSPEEDAIQAKWALTVQDGFDLGAFKEYERLFSSPHETIGIAGHFANGTVYHSPIGTDAVYGPILEIYQNQGSQTGDLGLPTSDPYYDSETSYLRSDFEKGYIRWTGIGGYTAETYPCQTSSKLQLPLSAAQWGNKPGGNGFGEYDPSLKGYHPAEDRGRGVETPVFAITSGQIKKISDVSQANDLSYGELMAIEHRGIFTIPAHGPEISNGQSYSYQKEVVNRFYSVYVHIIPWKDRETGKKLKEGDCVVAGQQIGILADLSKVGYGPHLHFEIRSPNQILLPNTKWAYVGVDRNNVNGFGYYYNVQPMIDGGVRNPTEVLQANQ